MLQRMAKAGIDALDISDVDIAQARSPACRGAACLGLQLGVCSWAGKGTEKREGQCCGCGQAFF